MGKHSKDERQPTVRATGRKEIEELERKAQNPVSTGKHAKPDEPDRRRKS